MIMHLWIFFFHCLLLLFLHGQANDVQYPPLWQTVPSSLKEYPLVDDFSTPYRSIDPWLYPHRLGLYKILIDVTTPLMPFCSSSNASNILFALPSQLGWQFNSNRLFTNGTMQISSDSWWASANYYLSVIPFLAAVDEGLIPDEPFRLVPYEDFCSTSFECFQQAPRAMKQWRQFFTHLKQSTKKIDDQILDQQYLAPMWLAYQASIDDALPLVQSKSASLPSNVEKLFGQNWARLIHLIAMTRKNTDLYETVKNQRSFLPDRMLVESDRPFEANGLPDLVNRSLNLLLSFRVEWLSSIEKIWTKLTCNYNARVSAQLALDSMAISKVQALKYLSKTILNACFFQCDHPFQHDL